MAGLPKSGLVTYEEWLRMPEVQDAVEEVVNGEVRIMPPNKWNHSEIVGNLRDTLATQLFELSTLIEQDGYIHSAPQLVAEVFSPANTRREREEKLADYASLGVPEVWVVSPEARNIEVLLLSDGQLRRSTILAEGTLQPILFPHVQIPISEIWPD